MKSIILEKGQVIKNYKELCKILGFKPTKGKGREYHIREFKRYCTYEKEGHKFIVKEVFKEIKPKIDKRATGKNSIYDELLDNIIINLLIDNDGLLVESTSKLLNEHLDFFTDEYKKLYNVGYTRYAEINGMSKGLVMEYQQKARDVVVGSLETSLNRLKRNKIITYKQNIIIRDPKFKTSFADNKTIDEIKRHEKEVYKEMNIIPFNRVNPNINSKFKSEVCERLEILAYWNVHNIKLIDMNTKRVEQDKDELIRRFINSVHSNTINRVSTDDLGNKFKPYSSLKFAEDLNTLTKLIWKLPGGYKTEYDKEQEQYKLMEVLFDGKNSNIPF